MDRTPSNVDQHVQSLFIRAQQRQQDLDHRARKNKSPITQPKAHDASPSKTSSLRPISQSSTAKQVRSDTASPRLQFGHTLALGHDLGLQNLSLEQDKKGKGGASMSRGQLIPPAGQVNSRKRALRSNTSQVASNARRPKSGAEAISTAHRSGTANAEVGSSVPPSPDHDRSHRPGILKPSQDLMQRIRATASIPATEDPTNVSLFQNASSKTENLRTFQIPEPPLREISENQLATEMKGIYEGLVMVEQKCINYDRVQAQAIKDAPQGQIPRLANDQWQALVALHRTLLHEHHDFFLASQHPAASQALRELPVRNSMAARMWKHAIHSFLEILRHHLPHSLDYMLAFIYIAYQMIALLLETVPSFKTTWIECLGDLARYRMAVEDDDLTDRDIWTRVARSWYSKAADYRPCVGRLYHHLAILARPYALQQLYYYCRSLTCVQPFLSARDSVVTLFDPILARSDTNDSWSSSIDANFIKSHAIIFKNLPEAEFNTMMGGFLELLDSHINKITTKWRMQGIYIAVANIAALFGYGSAENVISCAVRRHEQARSPQQTPPRAATQTNELIPLSELPAQSRSILIKASKLLFFTLRITLRRTGDNNVFPHIYVLLVFLLNIAAIPYVMEFAGAFVPWAELSSFLSTIARSERIHEGDKFNQPENRPLPEEYLIRGQVWCQAYWPPAYFEEATMDEEERSLELGSTAKIRAEKVLWLGTRLASHNVGLRYFADTKTFAPIEHESQSSINSMAAETPIALPARFRDTDSTMSGMDLSQPSYGTPLTQNEFPYKP